MIPPSIASPSRLNARRCGRLPSFCAAFADQRDILALRAIDWTNGQRDQVERVLGRYPVTSGRCESAAWEILPVGRERDPKAQIWQLVPTEGLYVVPKIEQDVFWFHHFTADVEAHCVDALTGADGTTRSAYLDEHWTETDAISWIAKMERTHEPW